MIVKRLTITHAALATVALLNAYVWISIAHVPDPRLHVSILDVGQGDSIYIEGPTGEQMVIDGGPDRSLARTLPKEMSLLDRSIDMVVETHPDMDHIAGLPFVFDHYKVSYFMSPGIPNSTSYALALDDAISKESGSRAFIARAGMRIHLGGGSYADVLYPDHDVSKGETNDGSIVMRLVYGKTSFMLTGDAPSSVEDYIISHNDNDALRTTVLKAGHHGSKYSTSDAWLDALQPQFVAFSAGEDNRYGHPNTETIERIQKEGAKIVSTIDNGTLRFVSDGTNVVLE